MDNWLRNNNTVRIIAVVIGIMLWVIVRLDVQNTVGPTQPTSVSQTYRGVSVKVTGLDEESYMLKSIDPEKVSLTVVGTAASLRRVNISDIDVTLDLSEALPGETLMPLHWGGIPNNVDVVLDPPNVTVVLEEKERREVPVTINTIGSPGDGYTAGTPVVQPNSVYVTVLSSKADEVASVVGLVDIDGATETVRQQVKLSVLKEDGTELDLDVTPAAVDVEVPITSPFKSMPLQIDLKGETPPGFAVSSFEQSVSEVTVYARQAYLNSLDFYKGLTIDLSGLTESKTYEFNLPLASGVERVEPAKATASVTIVPAVTKKLTGVPLRLNGKSDEYDYRVTAPEAGTVDVSVEAAPDVAAETDNTDVQAIIDVSNLAPGTHEVPVRYTLPTFVEPASEGNAETVTVEIAVKGESTAAEPEAPVPGTAPGSAPAEEEPEPKPQTPPQEGKPPADEGTETPAPAVGSSALKKK